MKKKRSLLYLIIAFVFAQLAWLGLLGLWIYWYVTNYLIFEQVGDQLSPQITIDSPNVLIFVLGIILMVGIEIAMVFTFRNLTVQIKLTGLYDNFIGHISHELKSPLASIQLYLETLSRKSVPDDKRIEFYNMMLIDTNRLKRLIGSILEISRLEQKTIAHDFRIYPADEIFRELVENSVGQFRIETKALTYNGDGAGLKCVLDKEAMRIVFDNLMSNSVKYTAGSPNINIKLDHTDKHLVIDFSDKGIGILPKDQKRIFDKFQRVRNENIPNVKGTGLGLYWTREILRFHGGQISVTSDGINQGATFRIKLPLYNASGNNFVNSLLKKAAKVHKSTN